MLKKCSVLSTFFFSKLPIMVALKPRGHGFLCIPNEMHVSLWISPAMGTFLFLYPQCEALILGMPPMWGTPCACPIYMCHVSPMRDTRILCPQWGSFFFLNIIQCFFFQSWYARRTVQSPRSICSTTSCQTWSPWSTTRTTSRPAIHRIRSKNREILSGGDVTWGELSNKTWLR